MDNGFINRRPGFLRPARRMEDRVLGSADAVLSAPLNQDPEAVRFYRAIATIVRPVEGVIDELQSGQILSLMETASLEGAMDNRQRMGYAERMAAKITERTHG